MDATLEERFNRLEALIQKHILKQQSWLTVQEFAQATDLHPKYVSELVLKNKIRGHVPPRDKGETMSGEFALMSWSGFIWRAS